VRDNRSLSDASAEAIRTTRALGGFVVSSNVATQGSGGRADLLLRIPQARVQDAIAQFSELGTITGQQVTVQDRQADLDRLAKRIDTLRIQLAEVRAQLAQGGLSEVDRLRLELRRQRLQGQLNQQTRQRTGIANEVALAEFSLTLETRRAAAAAGDTRIDGAIDDAVEVLSVAAAVGLFLLIVLAPLAAIAALVLLVRRSLRRREEERLLEQPRPTTTS
jgi:ribosomal protein L29